MSGHASASVTPVTSKPRSFEWEPQPAAGQLIDRLLTAFCSELPAIDSFARDLQAQTGTLLLDWVDQLTLPAEDTLAAELQAAGFVSQETSEGQVFEQPRGLFPRILLHVFPEKRLTIRVESIVDFRVARQCLPEFQPLEMLECLDSDSHRIEESVSHAMRQALVANAGPVEFLVMERHAGWLQREVSLDCIQQHLESFRLRRRHFEDDRIGLSLANSLIEAALPDLGEAWTCELFFAAERDYWQRRNRAAQIQKQRQDRLGLGWANHDHHTYRSSREHFTRLIAFLERLGFACRERFYAGQEAGWGAQVLEHSSTGIVVFADVDLSPDEVLADFAHEQLPPRAELGTIGLWCRLHGEAFLAAGMHHLECQFDFDAACQQLTAASVGVMKPFTDLPFLRQAFTEGEVWPVALGRIESLVRDGLISEKQAAQFREYGAVGSHFEILQRHDGYRGFNQSGISEIIRDTDPRRLTGLLGSTV